MHTHVYKLPQRQQAGGIAVTSIQFENYEIRYTLTSDEVKEAVRGLEPGAIQSLAVSVNGRWWPVKQPFVAAVSRKPGNIKDNSNINSRTALRLLARLGFPTHDTATQGPLPETTGLRPASISEEDRRLALSLAVELMKGQPKTAPDVTGIA